MTKYHRLDSLMDRIYFFIVMQAGKSKVTVLAESAPGESSLSGLQMAVFLLYLNIVQRKVRKRREREGHLFLFIRPQPHWIRTLAI